MIDLPPAPSKLLKSWARLTRWVLGLLVAAWLLFGLAWGALHWVIVPRIGEFRPLLEAQASKLLGIPVRIGTLVAYSNGLIPSVELTDVRLLDPEGHDALLLPRVLLAVSPQSLSQLEFEMLYVERPQLNIRRAPDGKIYVAGFDVSLSSGPDSAVADWLFSQAEFSIHDGTWCGPMSSVACHRWLCSKLTWCCAMGCVRTSCALTPPRLRPGASALACWASFNSRCYRCTTTSGSNGKARFTPPIPGWICRPCAAMSIWVLTSRRAMAHSMPGPM
jgi:hypothetical protein